MSEPINTAEMTREQLEQTATELGVKFQANTGDDTLRARIDESLGNPPPASPQDDGADKKSPAKAKKPAAKKRRIIIATHEQDKQPVQVGVNGRMYVIQRGKEVTVPASVVEVLRNAVQDVYDPKTMTKSQVSAYPFQDLGEA